LAAESKRRGGVVFTPVIRGADPSLPELRREFSMLKYDSSVDHRHQDFQIRNFSFRTSHDVTRKDD
jgi:hypothetical protein